MRGIEERQLVRPVAEHGNAQRLEELHRRRDVQERLRTGADDERLGAGELAKVAGDVEPSPRCTPPMPPVPMKPMPAARQAASVPPTVVAPTAPWTTQAARSRGPTLRASAVNRSS